MSIQSEINLVLNFAGEANNIIPRMGRLYYAEQVR